MPSTSVWTPSIIRTAAPLTGSCSSRASTGIGFDLVPDHFASAQEKTREPCAVQTLTPGQLLPRKARADTWVLFSVLRPRESSAEAEVLIASTYRRLKKGESGPHRGKRCPVRLRACVRSYSADTGKSIPSGV